MWAAWLRVRLALVIKISLLVIIVFLGMAGLVWLIMEICHLRVGGMSFFWVGMSRILGIFILLMVWLDWFLGRL
ncbi:hypothetical protein BI364_13945 [Acidihalobacter yilgarnensis]|uniref:Uncharacterized protein n=1 Tax=Acidihalobacter yilgarnensis TaxID=2819280 RepID=A0A1D8IR01_9GAMM|nr:hypothetical protein BI364_13945 [Acidihalobacter yilgarnensis]